MYLFYCFHVSLFPVTLSNHICWFRSTHIFEAGRYRSLYQKRLFSDHMYILVKRISHISLGHWDLHQLSLYS